MSTAQNKDLLLKYNKEVIEKGDMAFFQQIAATDFINHSAPEGMSNKIDGVIYFFSAIIHTALTDVTVKVLDMVAEDNKVATRKEITGIHTGPLFGKPATGKKITIKVIDIFTVFDGKLKEHWGENNFASVIQSLH
ncbi:ester cyclase [Flavobacterium sp. JLP]|uniref:ester cyclase n=1 Tax=unclassified Flavobacterium TaxID=196869 RepID=UPI00188AA812|nr:MULTISPECIES: ester cyclase [unclassified Flavobacterium]MBF4491245.1 ester cyclase [Flavobacterium sp. MR2016-29]MBF4505365.1 ester cyclase [Flavobacterium sp. JLP]